MTVALVQSPQAGNAEAEAMLCGSMMLEPKVIDTIADRLSPEDFSEPLFGRIFAAVVKEHSLGRWPNPVTLAPYFADDPAMKQLGGTGFLASLTGSGAQLGAAKGAAEQIRELAQRRRLVDGLTEAIEQGRDPNTPVAEVVCAAEDAIAASADKEDGTKQVTAAQCVAGMLDAIQHNEPGVTSGITALDSVLGPVRKRNLVILGGRPGMGKSAVASSYALGAASRKAGVLFVSLEMSAEEIGERMAADLCFDSNVQVPYSAITGCRLAAEQGREIARSVERIETLPLSIVDTGSATLARLNALVRRHKRRLAAKHQSLDLVIVDYLQLVSPDHREQSPYAAVSAVSRGLKALAKTHDVGVMAVTQLSRQVEGRRDKRPMMADLRDSGQIEQDADAICFLYAPEYYLLQEEPRDPAERVEWEADCQEASGKIEFIVVKRRRGPGGVGHGKFYRQFQAVRG